MTIPDADYPSTSDQATARARRDVAAVALIALGLCGLLTSAWLLSPWLLTGLLSAGVAGFGVYLGIDRS